jgi:hypothetical protein
MDAIIPPVTYSFTKLALDLRGGEAPDGRPIERRLLEAAEALEEMYACLRANAGFSAGAHAWAEQLVAKYGRPAKPQEDSDEAEVFACIDAIRSGRDPHVPPARSVPDDPPPVAMKPTVGRVVWYRPSQQDMSNLGTVMVTAIDRDKVMQPLAAQIVAVWSDRRVNLVVFDAVGAPHARQNILLVHGPAERPAPGVGYAEWMPSQKGQAARQPWPRP